MTACARGERMLATYSVEELDSDVRPSEAELRVESRALRIDRPQSHEKARRRNFDRGRSRGR